jgi:hypothetical protein
MTAPVYSVFAPVNVTLTATSITALSVLAGASFGLALKGIDLGSLGVTATDVPMRVEVCQWDGTGAGTPTGAATITQESGLVIASGMTAFYDYTVEPTTLVVARTLTLTPNSATLILPFDEPMECGPGDGFALRITATANVSVVPGMRVSRI